MLLMEHRTPRQVDQVGGGGQAACIRVLRRVGFIATRPTLELRIRREAQKRARLAPMAGGLFHDVKRTIADSAMRPQSLLQHKGLSKIIAPPPMVETTTPRERCRWPARRAILCHLDRRAGLWGWGMPRFFFDLAHGGDTVD